MKRQHITPLPRAWQLQPIDKKTIPAHIPFPDRGIVARVPGTVHTDLLRAGLIPDPFFADNEQNLQWVHETDWRYTIRFKRPEHLASSVPVFLVCEGLDTVAELVLNGDRLGTSANMFRTVRFPVADLQDQNELEIRFTSPTKAASQLEAEYGRLPAALNPTRVYLRKAQYSFGWDWGPVFPTVGIWRPLYLHHPDQAWIESVRFHTLNLEQQAADIRLEVDFTALTTDPYRIHAALQTNGETVCENSSAADTGSPARIPLHVRNPKLWWPHDQGEPFLYTLCVRLLAEDGSVLDEWQRRVGIRQIELQTRDKDQSVFRLVVNGRPIFARGANWIPADSFLPRVSETTYRSLLNMAVTANMNLIRVWGGGIYEHDAFYETCNELGLLVWQDFMFACGAYPETPGFIEEVRAEATENVKRLQAHPGIALWCGNNENEWLWYQRQAGALEAMPGFRLFHQILPEIVGSIDPGRPYWPSSPFSESTDDPNAPESGNCHHWQIWSGWQDYETVLDDASLFVTEFGFQAPAAPATLERVLPAAERDPQSRLFEFHNKQIDGNARLFRFLASHLPVRSGWFEFIYLTQLNQALALQTCVGHWRSRWPACAGTVIWQLNDCWPAVSWSLIDSNLRPKAAYHFARRFFSPRVVFAQWRDDALVLHACNHGRHAWKATLELFTYNAEDNGLEKCERKGFQIAGGKGQRILIVTLTYDRSGAATELEHLLWLYRIVDAEGGQTRRGHASALPYKHLRLPEVQLEIEIIDQNREHIECRLSAETLALAVWLWHPALEFEPNWLDVWPGETVTIFGRKRQPVSVAEHDIRIMTLNQFTPSPSEG